MDKSYILINILTCNKIEVRYFNNVCQEDNTYKYPTCFITYSSYINELLMLVSIYVNIQELSTYHKLYLGREIIKAGFCVNLQQIYLQG
uniref:Uncharacterized protein n=1 Tax=Periphykon beckeri TaxID=2006982 RepID=A0A1Z1M2S9_9FLOR|nr:hypothetical protein [Periphykon beckeri]ARW60369.1 hypothetical protein [Periphykon beckeri]